MGAIYPDVGYFSKDLGGPEFGEFTHWRPFIDMYADLINREYPQPSVFVCFGSFSCFSFVCFF